MATKYDKAVNYLIDYKEYDNEYVDNFTKPYEIDSDFKESVETLQEAINEIDALKETIVLYDEALTKMANFIGDQLGCCPDEIFNTKFNGCRRSECDGNGNECWKSWALYEKEELESEKQ